MGERSRRKFARLLLILILCLNFININGCLAYRKKAEAIKKMDAKELHYDANDWFFLIDTSEGHIGIYYAEIPVQHLFVELEELKQGVYPVLIYNGKDDQ